MIPIEEILKLEDGGHWTWPEGDYGKAEVWFKYGLYFLFEIPQFGGEPRYIGAYPLSDLRDLISIVNGWT